ncbi:transcriptional regulator, TetR family [Lutimaribacter pacificus]|uniref:Transcriptional regulator, TetR family n=1 Tax=Lutimaribacter pacificus TaxID=391948 RepID=A0A1H0M2I3_9RHOB|nr:TetR/AcrR family transcriptional regulator [Lutimaribacter pacificus]SDO74574.1 transcriptional regulator, TetR family [Lutimaribacter pacificus]SHK76960.1 transcriptional regulator, TetR family [Lutimaribacter pacificus]
MTDDKPKGKQATTEALLDAADELFAERGPNTVTVRDISLRANVNHGLVHRHFGSKEALLDQVLERHVKAFTGLLSNASEPAEIIPLLQRELCINRPSFVRLLAFLMLERREALQIARRPGGVATFAQVLRGPGIPEEDTRKLAAILSAFLYGWQLFREFTVTAAACETSLGALDDDVERILVEILDSVLHKTSVGAA